MNSILNIRIYSENNRIKLDFDTINFQSGANYDSTLFFLAQGPYYKEHPMTRLLLGSGKYASLTDVSETFSIHTLEDVKVKFKNYPYKGSVHHELSTTSYTLPMDVNARADLISALNEYLSKPDHDYIQFNQDSLRTKLITTQKVSAQSLPFTMQEFAPPFSGEDVRLLKKKINDNISNLLLSTQKQDEKKEMMKP